jgi:hypothetical protein
VDMRFWEYPPAPAVAYESLENEWRWPENRNKRALRRGLKVLYTLLADPLPPDVRIYAQTDIDDDENQFWYKVYFLTRAGTLKRDTTGEHLETQAHAQFVIKSQHLAQVSMEALMQNWQTYILWERHCPISVWLLRAWCWRHGKPYAGEDCETQPRA